MGSAIVVVVPHIKLSIFQVIDLPCTIVSNLLSSWHWSCIIALFSCCQTNFLYQCDVGLWNIHDPLQQLEAMHYLIYHPVPVESDFCWELQEWWLLTWMRP